MSLLHPAHLSSPPRTLRIILFGQPNTGKSSLFNRLTGLHQRVGNYPGLTVERKEGELELPSASATLVDLPGTYSLNPASLDESVAVDVISGHDHPRPDALLCVADAANLPRTLLPALQAASLGIPLVVAANFADEAEARGMKTDYAALSAALGIPVIPTIARTGSGVPELRKALAHAVENKLRLSEPPWPPGIRRAIAHLLDRVPPGPSASFQAQRALFNTSSAVGNFAPPDLEQCRQWIRDEGFQPATAEPVLLLRHAKSLIDPFVRQEAQATRASWSRKLDRLLLHPFLGILIFSAIMFAVFQAVYSWAGPLMDGIESAIGLIQKSVGPALESAPILHSLVIDGVIAGVGGVLVFLPQIIILTFLIALLEDTGYLARAAYLADRLFSWCGLNGKCFVPLMSSYACAIPGIMATRTIEEPRARLMTLLAAPLMSCSARLPVYVLMIGTFIEPRYGATAAALTLLAMHFLGPLVALPAVWALNTFVFRTKPPPFLLEMPPYRLPSLRDLFWRLWLRTRRFLSDAGTIIFCMSIIIWALLYFPRPAGLPEQVRQQQITAWTARGRAPETLQAAWQNPESDEAAALAHATDAAYISQSFLGRLGQTLQPVFAPAGFDWKITIGVLASFPAREVVISTLGIIYNLGGDEDEESTGLRKKLQAETWPTGPRAGQPVFTVASAAAVMVFFALCLQCGATVAIMGQEAGWRWAWGAFAATTLLAWIGAVATYQILNPLLAP